jgi:hypothetical protein
MLTRIIQVIHLLFALFIILTPFFGNEYFLSLHFLFIPLMLAHWATNQSTCVLTEVEKFVRGSKVDEDTFFGKIIGPVYKFKTQREENLFVWTAAITLWLVTLVKLQTTGFVKLRSDFAQFREVVGV